MEPLFVNYGKSGQTYQNENDSIQTLLAHHKSRYKRETSTHSQSTVSVQRHKSLTKSLESVTTSPLAFLGGYAQTKRFAAIGSNPEGFCDYVIHQWASGQDLSTSYKWLVRIKASDWKRGSIDNAIYNEVLKSSEQCSVIPTREDILQDIKSSFLLLVEGDASELSSDIDEMSIRTVNHIVLVTTPHSKLHTRFMELIHPQEIYFSVTPKTERQQTKQEASNQGVSNQRASKQGASKQKDSKQGASKQKASNQEASIQRESTTKGASNQEMHHSPSQHTIKTLESSDISVTKPLSSFIIRDIYSQLIQNEEIKEKTSSKDEEKDVNILVTDDTEKPEWTVEPNNYSIITENMLYVSVHSEFLLNSVGVPLSPNAANKEMGLEKEAGVEGDTGDLVSKQAVVEMLYGEMSRLAIESEPANEGDPITSGCYDDDMLEELCEKLSMENDWPSGFQGMYVDEGTIIVDVIQDEIPNMEKFLFAKCRHVFVEAGIRQPRKFLEFVEQEEQSQYCVKRGSTVCNIPDKEAFHKVISSPSIRGIACIERQGSTAERTYKQEYGTVGCVSAAQKSSDSNLVLLTARHIFERNLEGIKDTLIGHKLCKYFCENGDSMDFIAEKSYGILGGSKDRNKGVDISVIPIKARGQTTSQQGASADSSVIPQVYNGPTKALLDRTVEKLGATIPHSTGYICKTNYWASIANKPRQECLLVLRDDKCKSDKFSAPGDSGALVITNDREPTEAIGLISKNTKWRNRHGQDEYATVVVLLKNCFDAIEHEFGTKLQLCGVWEECSVTPVCTDMPSYVASNH